MPNVTTDGATVDRCAPRRSARARAVLASFVLVLAIASRASAIGPPRCFFDPIADMTDPLLAAVWTHFDKENGPLGCPLGPPQCMDPSLPSCMQAPRAGQLQAFQHGWLIDISSPSTPDFVVVAIPRLSGWWIWWRGAPVGEPIFAAEPPDPLVLPLALGPADLKTFGQLFHTDEPRCVLDTSSSLEECAQQQRPGGRIALFDCPLHPPPFIGAAFNQCDEQLTPTLTPRTVSQIDGQRLVDGSDTKTPAVGIDFSSMGANALEDGAQTPTGSDPVAERESILKEYFGCWTVLPKRADHEGENWTSYALGMLANSQDVCPLVLGSTTDRVRVALDAWQHKATKVPGSSAPAISTKQGPLPINLVDVTLCASRDGEHDVDMQGLLRMMYAYPQALGRSASGEIPATSTYRHVLDDLLAPWSGPSVSTPPTVSDVYCGTSGVPESENHLLLIETDRYLTNALLNDAAATNPASHTTDVKHDNTSNREWLLTMLQVIAKRDFFEYNSLPYQRYTLEALLLLHDYAPDESVRTAATMLLDYSFAKLALASNQMRETRPYRRRNEPARYADDVWFDNQIGAQAQALMLLDGGGLSRADGRTDLTQVVTAWQGDQTLTDLNARKTSERKAFHNDPFIGLVDEDLAIVGAAVAHSGYRLPRPIRSLFESRFGDLDATHSATGHKPAAGVRARNPGFGYFQTIHHRETAGLPIDDRVFLQTNGGAEIYSGAGEWTISAGGTRADTGLGQNVIDGIVPGTATMVAAAGVAVAICSAVSYAVLPVGFGLASLLVGATCGAVVPGLLTSYIRDKAVEAVSSGDADQHGLVRETQLIPTHGALTRADTLRFSGSPLDPAARTNSCAAQGFLCGLNLIMPRHPFPDGSPCPKLELPTGFATFAAKYEKQLGCQMLPPFDYGDRTEVIWEHGNGVLVSSGPLSGALVGGMEVTKATVRIAWDMSGVTLPGFDRFMFRAIHDQNVSTTIPGAVPLFGAFDYENRLTFYSTLPTTSTSTKKEGSADLTLDTSPTGTAGALGHWNLSVIGCNDRSYDPTAAPAHPWDLPQQSLDCAPGPLPAITLDVPPPMSPNERPFACKVFASNDAPRMLSMEVGGDCATDRDYSFYVAVWVEACDSRCRQFGHTYGFAIVSPARSGWTFAKFNAAVIPLMNPAHPYSPVNDESIDVPWPGGVTIPVQFNIWKDQVALWSIRGTPSGDFAAATPQDQFNDWPLASGSVISSPGDGTLKIVEPTEGRAMRLDYSDVHNPTIACLSSVGAVEACVGP